MDEDTRTFARGIEKTEAWSQYTADFSPIPRAKVRVSLPTNPPSYSPIRQITVTGSAAPNCLLLASGWLVPILNS